MEGWFAQPERRAPYRDALGRVADLKVADLKTAIRRSIEARNEHSAKPFRWSKTAELSQCIAQGWLQSKIN
ncbi:hypothetical protein IN820_07670 [Pseudomonas sp. AL-54]|nr:hypothetical protein [Pseudomonas lopnurensis]